MQEMSERTGKVIFPKRWKITKKGHYWKGRVTIDGWEFLFEWGDSKTHRPHLYVCTRNGAASKTSKIWARQSDEKR